ncbi:hypothetical protein BX285_0923 [Streptomyces sp. 1114.5]|uniref:hypothetical protein n=1 Tax=Streptomyces sp. 1114.5 TaxID=1938830 RepID=UPI000EABE5AF|nr:hypothetical protein [Streptomyces sp. 1114.5]RKT16580.1 hypothetical protein BX285_0923 [Streptomyces sp. 1114.5]
MPATLTNQRVSTAALRSGVDMFGEKDPEETAPRVAVRFTLNLSFGEILGLLAFNVCELAEEDLGDDAAVMDALRFELASSSYRVITDNAGLALAYYTGRRPYAAPSYLRALGHAVTRVFGVASDEPFAARETSARLVPAGVLPADGCRV